MKRCEDCNEEYPDFELRPWKYEPDVLLCEDCYDQRLEEEQEEE